MTETVILLSGKESRARAINLAATAPQGTCVAFRKARRSLPQNDRLHAMLTDVARQKEWAGAKRTVEAWKDIFTAALRSANHGLDVVPGINGGFVLLGMHTSQMSKAEVGELMTLIEAFCAEHNIALSDPTPEPAKQPEAAQNAVILHESEEVVG
ncbi:MAG: recombination protein NinB [Ignavibacteriales bacterium]